MLIRMLLRALLPRMCTLVAHGVTDSAAHGLEGTSSSSLLKQFLGSCQPLQEGTLRQTYGLVISTVMI
jgi:hypothetical protein